MADGSLPAGILLSALEAGVVFVRGDRVEYANPAAAQLLAVDISARVEHLTPSVLVELIDRARAGEKAEETFARGVPARWIRGIASRLDEVEAGVMLVLQDVTEQRKVEAMRRDFVADASHELKTPVASILAAAETLLIAMDKDPDSARRFARQIHSTAGRLSQTISELLDLSRLESGSPDAGSVDLRAVTVKEADRVADRAVVRGIDLVVEGEDVTALANRKDVRLAVRNLLENALDYTPPGGKITISIRADDDTAIVEVADTGTGIPGRDLPRVFERFYRVDDARSHATGGTGLGLAIVKHVAERYGGSVEAESELGAGSVFRIRLPLI
jgi:signal transduction histidine kinase